MNNNITIRQPDKSELLAIRIFRRREMLGEDTPRPDLSIDPYDLSEDVIHLAAYDGDEVVSAVRLALIPEDPRVYEISRMVTSRDYRGQGIGRRLLTEAEKIARQRGVRGFVLDSREDAQEFYAKLGYWRTGRRVKHQSDDWNYVMVKQVEVP